MRPRKSSAPPMEVSVTTIDNDPPTFRGPDQIRIVNVTTNVELQLPLSDVFALFGGAGLGVVTYSVGDTARHYGE